MVGDEAERMWSTMWVWEGHKPGSGFLPLLLTLLALKEAHSFSWPRCPHPLSEYNKTALRDYCENEMRYWQQTTGNRTWAMLTFDK